MKENNGWIPIKERLPYLSDRGVLVWFPETESAESVHVFDYFKEITSGMFDGKQTYTIWAKSAGITHWMELPEGPRVVTE